VQSTCGGIERALVDDGGDGLGKLHGNAHRKTC
jgi:hypothetical protein